MEPRRDGLKNCPHCGGKPHAFQSFTHKGWDVTCSKNGCRLVMGATLEDALKMWNEPRVSH
jgi:hypothetical protein